MANIYKKINDDLISNTQKDVYTVPGNSRTLAMLGTLPAQAGVMTLSPTRMGNAELRQMPKGPPSIINQGGGNGGGGVKDSGGSTGGYSYDSGGRQGFGYGLAMGGFI